MEIQPLEHHHLRILLLLVFIFNITVSFSDYDIFETPHNPYIKFTYNRFDEIERHCGFILPSASELQPDDNRGDRIKKELSFFNGDWDHDSGGSPLMPFDSRDMPNSYYGYGAPQKLVSFSIIDVDSVRRAENTVSISGVMEIGITRSSNSLSYSSYERSPRFRMEQGTSRLTILFEGIYIESKENGGQVLMCLLGNATMPSWSKHVDSWESDNHQSSPLIQDDEIMLLLHYPKAFTLTTRGIIGEMKSLKQKWNLTYFDKVHISSQLGRHSKYQFGSEEVVSKACSPYPYQDKLVDPEVKMYTGDEYCEKLQGFISRETFRFVPNSESKFGPFVLGKEMETTTNGDLQNFMLMVQDLKCESGNDSTTDIIKMARVSAVFRLIRSSGYRFSEEHRTGLSGTTLSAEGIWHSSNGQLCLIGCLGLVGDPSERCKSRICLYFPLIVSIKQRNIVFGTISSIDESKKPHDSLVFEMVSGPQTFLDRYQWNRHLKWSYNYSKIKEAREFQKISQPSKLGTTVRKSFLRYPSSKGNDIANFSFLSDILSIHLRAVPYSGSIIILSMGSLFGRYWPQSHQLQVEKGFHSVAETTEISGHLSIYGGQVYNFSLFFEGLYDPVLGNMYLIGCQDLRASNNGTNLEQGMDCMIQIKVQYPPRNARWLLNPKIKISINSIRSEGDSLHFSLINLDMFLLSYKKKLDDVIFRRTFEEFLRIFTLVGAIICTLNQSKNKGHPTAYISVVMLGVHAFSYSIPLITGDEILFKWKEVKPYNSQTYDIMKFQRFQVLESCIKILLLVALLLIIRLIQKVHESRSRQHGHDKKPKPRIPSDKLVFLVTLVIHVIGFLIFHAIRKAYANQALKWWGEMENYGGLVQDFFLIPQIIGNALWHIKGKPLRKFYYFGFTMIRVLLQVYDYARDPVPNPQHSDDELQYMGMEFYSKLGNITIAVIVIVLAIIVYIQQRSSYNKCSQIKKMEECENLSLESDLYEKLFPDE